VNQWNNPNGLIKRECVEDTDMENYEYVNIEISFLHSLYYSNRILFVVQIIGSKKGI